MNNILRRSLNEFLVVLAIASTIALAGAAYAVQVSASEITGTLSVEASGGGTTGGGSIAGVVIGGTSESTASGSGSSGSGGSRSSHRRILAVASPSGSVIQSDGSLGVASDFTGTGGGYDPSLDSYLASANDGGISSGLSADDVVAYNTADNVAEALQNTAAVGNTGSPAQRAMVAVIIALALAGLGWYGVSAYRSYRNESGM